MRVKFKRAVKGWVFLFILILLSGASFGATFNITTGGTPARNHDNSANLTAGSAIQVFRQVGTKDKPDAAGAVADDTAVTFRDSGGADVTANLVFNGSGNVDFFGLADMPVGAAIYLRIWEGTPGSGAGKYYIDVPYTVRGNPVETVSIAGARTTILNAMPPIPSIDPATLSEKLARRPLPSTVYDLQLKYDIIAGTPDGSITDGYQVQVIMQNADLSWPSWPTSLGPDFFAHSDGLTPLDAYYVSGKTYRLRARALNHLGPTAPDARWSAQVEYQSLAGGGGPMTVTCNFNTTSALGVNQFSIPARLPVTFDGPTVTGRSINTIQDLIDAIVAERVMVNTLGWWDPVRQVMVGWSELAGTPREQNSPGSRTDALVRDRAYQVSVSAPITFTLTGTR